MKIRRALISVSDKTGLVDFAKGLSGFGVEILSTGGTFVTLRAAEVLAVEVSHHTGFPEILDGRVKTLHPKIHGGILARRDDPEHRLTLEKHQIGWIDLVVVNLYPFEKTIAREDVTFEDAIENIDIGGPSMIRSAAKNHEAVTVIVDIADYAVVLEEMKKSGGEVSQATRSRLAQKAYARTSQYDATISNYLAKIQSGEASAFPSQYTISGSKLQDLRYGENPHQKAAFYKTGEAIEASVANAQVLNGKELSFNNIVDLEAALSLAKEFEEPTVVIIKHTNPCGCASRPNLSEAFADAWAGDPLSAFGSVIACNRELDQKSAEFLASPDRFVEAIIAPGFSPEAFATLTTKPKWGKNVRLLKSGAIGPKQRDTKRTEIRQIYGGFVAQTSDLHVEAESECKVVTKKSPTADQLKDLLFAMKICKHVKSNAIVLAKSGQLLGTGAGQMSRVDSVKIAVEKAGDRVKGSVLASDAFFPFPDGVENAAKAGVVSILQPGGSMRDQETVAIADKAGISMLFSGIRHFYH